MSRKTDLRHEALIDAVLAGTHDAETLSQRLDVSLSTLRRDLNQLATQGRLVRTYGGAVPAGGHEPELDLLQRKHLHKARKEAIGRAAAALIHPGETLILDGGTTIAALAQRLRGQQELKVITNSLQVWTALAGEDGIELLVLGGQVRTLSGATQGFLTELALRHLSADHAFLGADGIVAGRGLCEARLEQIHVKTLMMSYATRTHILADSSKLGRAAQQAWAPLDRPWTLVTDREATETQLAPFRQLPGVSVVVAD